MDFALMQRALTLLSEALELMDQAKAPADLGAHLSGLIERIRDLSV